MKEYKKVEKKVMENPKDLQKNCEICLGKLRKLSVSILIRYSNKEKTCEEHKKTIKLFLENPSVYSEELILICYICKKKTNFIEFIGNKVLCTYCMFISTKSIRETLSKINRKQRN